MKHGIAAFMRFRHMNDMSICHATQSAAGRTAPERRDPADRLCGDFQRIGRAELHQRLRQRQSPVSGGETSVPGRTCAALRRLIQQNPDVLFAVDTYTPYTDPELFPTIRRSGIFTTTFSGICTACWNGTCSFRGRMSLRRKNAVIWTGFSCRTPSRWRAFATHGAVCCPLRKTGTGESGSTPAGSKKLSGIVTAVPERPPPIRRSIPGEAGYLHQASDGISSATLPGRSARLRRRALLLRQNTTAVGGGERRILGHGGIFCARKPPGPVCGERYCAVAAGRKTPPGIAARSNCSG